MSRSKWIAAALVALAMPAMPAAHAGDRTRVQITIAPYWGWGPSYRPGYRGDPRGHYDGYRVDRHNGYGRYYGGQYGGYSGGPAIRFDYRDRGGYDGYYGYGGYRPGGYLRYDSRRDRDYYRGHRDDRHGDDRDRRGRDWRD